MDAQSPASKEMASNHVLRESQKADTTISSDVDQAYHFLAHTASQDDGFESIRMNGLRRKVDWRIVPLMFLVYTMNLIDKVALNVSRSNAHAWRATC